MWCWRLQQRPALDFRNPGRRREMMVDVDDAPRPGGSRRLGEGSRPVNAGGGAKSQGGQRPGQEAPSIKVDHESPPGEANERRKSSSIACLPFSRMDLVPVPVKCGCVITGLAAFEESQSSPLQRNQPSSSWSNTCSGLLHNLANSAPQPVPPRTVLSSRIVAHDVDLLTVVDLVPERLQDLADRRALGVAPVHEPRRHTPGSHRRPAAPRDSACGRPGSGRYCAPRT